MMRTFLRTLFFIPFFLLFTLGIIACLFGLALLPGTRKMMRTVELVWARGVVRAAGMKLKSSDLTPGNEANYLFVANHQSWLDIPVFLCLLAPFRPRFVAKQSLFSIPFFGKGMRLLGHLAIDRENNRKGMRDIQEVVERLEEGESVLIFPEGTRNRSCHRLQTFHIGAFVLALKTDRPLIPVIIQGTGKVLRRGSLLIRPGTVTVRAAAPVWSTAQYTLKQRAQFKDDIRAVMQDLLTETQP